MLIAKPVQALAAFGCMLAGVPFYVYFRKRNDNLKNLREKIDLDNDLEATRSKDLT
jgi:hypothetical protein